MSKARFLNQSQPLPQLELAKKSSRGLSRPPTILEPSAADLSHFVDHEIKCVGMDTLNVEKYGFKEGKKHKKLLSNGIGIIENLNANLKKILDTRSFLDCMRLPLRGVDGAPARAIAFTII